MDADISTWIALAAFAVSIVTTLRAELRANRAEKREDTKRDDEERRWRAEAKLERKKMRTERARFEKSLAAEREKFRTEMEQWRREWRGSKRADVAGRAIVESLRVVDALDLVTDIMILAAPSGEDIVRELERRWALVDAALGPLREVRREAEAWLPGDAVRVIAELEAHVERLRARLRDWYAATDFHDKIAKRDLAIGGWAESETTHARLGILHVLRPLAGAEDEPGTPPAPLKMTMVRRTYPIAPAEDGTIVITGPAVEGRVLAQSTPPAVKRTPVDHEAPHRSTLAGSPARTTESDNHLASTEGNVEPTAVAAEVRIRVPEAEIADDHDGEIATKKRPRDRHAGS
jgi:hypothetical protein